MVCVLLCGFNIGVNMNKMRKPPDPPECRLQCSFCGYESAKSKYNHKCFVSLILSGVILMIPLILLIITVVKLYSLAG